MNLINDFKLLMSHLNAEDNDMANEFLEKLEHNENFPPEESEEEWNGWTPTETSESPYDGLVDFILRDGFFHNACPSADLIWSTIPSDPDCEIVKWRKSK